LETARIATGRQLEVLVRDFRRAQRDTKASQDPELAPSEASWGWKRGRFAGRFDCRPDHGAIVEAALEDAYNKGRPDETEIDNATPVAEGELRDDETPRVTRADALVALATGYLAGRENGSGMLPELTQITLHRNCRPDGTDPGAHDPLFPTLLPGHGAIHARLAALLECDATVVDQPMWCGHPSALPSRTRRFNRRQRRALAARDLTCRFPGCGRTRHLHAHHSIRATDGGPTTLINGVLLCPQHHTLIHIHGHLIVIEPNGAVTIQRTDGTTLRGAPPPPAIGEQIPLPIATRERATGTGEPLTHWARDVITATWHNHTHHDESDPDPPPDG
jgi:hypothetical protein